MTFKPKEPILEPWICSQYLNMVFAPRGVGKTHFCLGVAFAIATGGRFIRWRAPEPRKVLYLDGELSGVSMQQRLRQHFLLDGQPMPENLRVFTPDLLPDGATLPDISTLEGQVDVENMIEPDTAVVIIDNLSAWARTGRENEAESWLPMSDWLLRLRRRGLAVLLVHHAGKGGQQRGTSKREDLLDVVIGLRRPDDYDPTQGAVFVVEFTKGRDLKGNDLESLELAMEGDETRVRWTHRTVEASNYDRVVAMARDGMKQNEIAAELNLHKSNVSRALKRARESGDLPVGK